MAQDSENPTAPITLEYQRLEKRRKRATGGLLLLSGFLCLIALLVSGATAFGAVGHTSDPLYLALAALPITIAGTYLAMAILFHRRVRWAGFVALVLTGLIALGFLFLTLMLFYDQLTATRYDPIWLLILVDILFLLICLGPIAVFIEVLWALRNTGIWVETSPGSA